METPLGISHEGRGREKPLPRGVLALEWPRDRGLLLGQRLLGFWALTRAEGGWARAGSAAERQEKPWDPGGGAVARRREGRGGSCRGAGRKGAGRGRKTEAEAPSGRTWQRRAMEGKAVWHGEGSLPTGPTGKPKKVGSPGPRNQGPL